ncbi:hypothetical protein IWQ54_006592 [Labrenzia sp. EL_195]|nr:hypothetical protein [Labrenzia sp. EL_195]
MKERSKAKAEISLGEGFEDAIKTKTVAKYPRVTLRLTENELSQLRTLAHGVSVSAYIRNCVFGSEAAPRKRRAYMPGADQEALARVLYLLGQTHFANNLNQIAYHANCGTLSMNQATEDEIRETCAHIAFIRVKLIEALGIKNKD